MKKPSLAQRIAQAWKAFSGRQNVFKGSEMSRLFLDWMAQTMTPDQEIRGDIRKLRARARDLARNDGYCKQYLRLLTTNVVGPTGFKLQSRVRRGTELDEDSNTRIETAWREWVRSKVTVDGRHNFRQLQVQLLRAMATDGEVFLRKYLAFSGNPHGFALQVIDADMLDETFNRSPSEGLAEIRMGVEVNSLGRPVAYHFFEGVRGTTQILGAGTQRIRVPAEEVLHLYDSDRANQTRGVTWLHPIMAPLKMLGGYEEAELVASRVAAAKMGWIVSQDGAAGELKDTDVPSEFEAAPGTMEQLPAGYRFEGWDPQHPVAAFGLFIKACLRKIGSGLGISYNALANDLEGVNYSSLRDGRLAERDNYRVLQENWKDNLVQPIYETWMSMALLTGALDLPSRDSRLFAPFAEWTARGWQWVDPLKDIQAAEKAVALGVASRTEICGEEGKDVEDVFENLAREREMAQELGLSVNGSQSSAADASQSEDGQNDGNAGDAEDQTDSENGRHLIPAGRFAR